MLSAIFWSALATGSILIGMALAYRNLVSQRWTGLIMAFGAGAIISAAAYQLVLMTSVNNPNVRQVIGSEKKLTMGRMNAFTRPKMIATKIQANNWP